MRLVPKHFSIRSKTATVNIRVSQQPHVVPKWQLQYSKGPDAHRTFATYPAKIKAETISTSESHLDNRYRSPGLVYSPWLSTAPLEAYLWHLVAGERIGAFQISSQCLAPWHLSIEFLDFIQRAIHESRSALSEIKGKDAGRDFILMNGVLEEGGVIEVGNGRESHAKDPRRYE